MLIGLNYATNHGQAERVKNIIILGRVKWPYLMQSNSSTVPPVWIFHVN
jgi:hypothetical protein